MGTSPISMIEARVEDHPRLDDERQAHADRLDEQQPRKYGRQRCRRGPGISPMMASRPVELCLFDSADAEVETHLAFLCPSRPTWSGTPICPTCSPGSSTATASTGRTSRSRPPLQPQQGPARPLRPAIGRRSLGRFAVRLPDRRPDDDLSFDDRDSAAVRAAGGGGRPAFTWGDDRPLGTPGTRRSSTSCTSRASPSCTPRCPSRCGHLPRPGLRAGDRLPAHLGVTAVELLPVHTLSTTGIWSRGGLRNYWGYNTLATSRPSALRGAPRRSTRCASSR